jgi:DNA helicase-2/ATP-dependent DNA helicase PcrA
MHELTIVAVGELSPLLARVDEQLYTLDEAKV